VLGIEAPPGPGGPVTEPVDRALGRRLAAVAAGCTAAFEAYDHARALDQAERFFWFFCDDYLELVKLRAYGERGPGPAASAVATLREALSVLLRLLAPFLPFVTEEAWSWWQPGSVHRAPWPAGGAGDPGGTAALDAAAAALAAVRRARSQGRLPMKVPVAELILTGPAAAVAGLAAVAADVAAAGRVGEITLRVAEGGEAVHEVRVQGECRTGGLPSGAC
jgi:valyl-tRNA synthetase